MSLASRLSRAVFVSVSAVTLASCEDLFFVPVPFPTHLTPVPVARAFSFVEVQASSNHVCGLTATGELFCWGGNDEGQVGRAPLGESCNGSPCEQEPQRVEGVPLLARVRLTAGAPRTCGLTAAGQAWCWGFGVGGQLGDGLGETSYIPRQVAGSHAFADLTIGSGHSCGRTATGAVWCWGVGSNGAFGNGQQYAVSSIPVRVADSLTFTDVRVGDQHSCGITTAGSSACWGSAWYGAIGNGVLGNSNPALYFASPTPVVTGELFTQIVVGSSYSCGLTAAGRTYCWGAGYAMGTGDSGSASPVPIASAHIFESIYGGNNHACGLTAIGDLYCWGDNFVGMLGDGTDKPRLGPVKVRIPEPVTQVSDHPSCAVTVTGKLYCWGPYERRQHPR